MSLFLQALACENFGGRPPVWLMRQAGRYMPSYQKLRTQHSLWQLFHTPELAAEVTLLPMELLDVDAAILFSDILVVAEMLGKKIVFPEKGGPYVEPPLQTAQDVAALTLRPAREVLGYVEKTIELLHPVLTKPLIGFCGGPLTLASYLIERGGKNDLAQTKAWIATDPVSFHMLLSKLTAASIDYLRMQIEAGVDALQIFDSWAGLLPPGQFQEFVCRYLQEIVDSLRPYNIPIILFCRGSCTYRKQLETIAPSAISFDGERSMRSLRDETAPNICVQGNIAPELLCEAPAVIRRHVTELLESMQGERGFIANLGHGVLPQTPFDNVRLFVDLVKNYHLASGGREQRMASGLPPEAKPNLVPLS